MKKNWGSYLALSMLGFQNATLMFFSFLPGYPISVSVAGVIVKEAEVDAFLEFSSFFNDPTGLLAI